VRRCIKNTNVNKESYSISWGTGKHPTYKNWYLVCCWWWFDWMTHAHLKEFQLAPPPPTSSQTLAAANSRMVQLCDQLTSLSWSTGH